MAGNPLDNRESNAHNDANIILRIQQNRRVLASDKFHEDTVTPTPP